MVERERECNPPLELVLNVHQVMDLQLVLFNMKSIVATLL
jgi:hypothetical protein